MEPQLMFYSIKSRSINHDIEDATLSCGIRHEGYQRSNLVLSWFFNEDPTPFLLWRIQDDYPDIFGRIFNLADTQFLISKKGLLSTDTKLIIKNPSVLLSGFKFFRGYWVLDRCFKEHTPAWFMIQQTLNLISIRKATWSFSSHLITPISSR